MSEIELISSQLETSENGVKDPRAKMILLLDKLRAIDDEYAEKRELILAELSGVLRGGEGIGAKLSRLKAFFSETRAERYRDPYLFAHGTDTAHLKRFLAHYTEDEITGRMYTYLRLDDPFLTKNRHPFSLFVKGFNTFVAAALPVADHSASDTSDKLRGLRGE